MKQSYHEEINKSANITPHAPQSLNQMGRSLLQNQASDFVKKRNTTTFVESNKSLISKDEVTLNSIKNEPFKKISKVKANTRF
jgi:hypothetical protein